MSVATPRRPGWGLALLAGAQLALLLSGCTSTPSRPTGGRDLSNIPDAVPKWEPRAKYGNPDWYEVDGRRYHVMASANGFVERGVASWYGPNFHGKRTSSGDPYDMYSMTAAHKTLPLPTYARVTNLQNGRTAIVRINDRGPFKDDRIIDLSYSAARKLGVDGPGTAQVEIRAITPAPGDTGTLLAANDNGAGVTVTPAVMDSLPMEPITPAPAPQPIPVAASSHGAPPVAVAAAASSAAASAAASEANGENMVVYLQAGAFASRANAEKLRAKLSKAVDRPIIIQPITMNGTVLHRVRLGPFPSFADADRYAVDMSGRGLERPRVAIEH